MIETTEKRAYKHLRRKLAMGALPPGSRVSAVAVAKEIGVSATPVTQAIRRLEIEGFIDLVPHLGTFVRKPDLKEVEDLYDLRIALETHAAAKAAGRLSEAALAELELTCQIIDDARAHCLTLGDGRLDAATLRRLALADLKFHMIIIHASGNRRIIKLMDDSHVLMRGMTMLVSDSARYWAANLQSTGELHRQVLDALRRGDRKTARRALAKHLRDSIHEARTHFRGVGADATSVYNILREIDSPTRSSVSQATTGLA